MNNDEIKNDIDNNEEKKNLFLTGRIMMVIGVIFVIISGLIFATTTWFSINDYFKVGMIIAISCGFLSLSAFFEKKLKLEKTGFAFFTIGIVFMSTVGLAVGFFAVLGSWFSLTGEGVYMVYALTAFILAISLYKGIIKYSSLIYAYIFYLMITVIIICVCLQFIQRYDIIGLIFSIYAFSCVFHEKHIKTLNKVFEKTFSSFVYVNTVLLGIISIIISGNGFFAFLALVVFSIVSLKDTFKNNVMGLGIYSYSILMLFACYKLIVPNDYDSVLIMAVASISAISVLNFTVGINDRIKLAIKICSVVLSVIELFIFGIGFVFISEWNIINQLTVTVLGINILFSGIKNRDKINLYFFSFVLLIFNGGLAKLLCVGYICNLTVIFSVLMVLSQIAFVNIKKIKLRSDFSDMLFLFSVLICGIVNTLFRFQFLAAIISGIIITLIIIIWSNSKIISKFCSFLLPYIFFMGIWSIYLEFPELDNLYLYFILFISAISFGFLFLRYKKILMHKDLEHSFLISVLIFSFVGAMENSCNNSIINCYLLIPFIIIISKTILGYKEQSNNNWYYGAYLTGLIFFADTLWNIIIKLAGNEFSIEPTVNAMTILVITSVLIKLLSYKFTENYKNKIKYLTLVVLNLGACFLTIHIFGFYLSYIYRYTAICVCLLAVIITGNEKNLTLISRFLLFFGMISFVYYAEVKDLFFIMILSVLIGKIIYFTKHRKIDIQKHFDWISYSVLIPIIKLFALGSSFERVIVLGVFMLICISPISKKTINKTFFTLGLMFFNIALSLQPYFEIGDMFRLEFSLMPLMLLCAEIKIIWREYETKVDWIIFTIVCIVIFILGIDALSSQYIFDTLFITVGCFFILFLSHLIKKIRWFALSSAVLIFMSIYMTCMFWQSKVWWFYLLLIGLILITLAAFNEYNRIHPNVISEKLKWILKDWKW